MKRILSLLILGTSSLTFAQLQVNTLNLTTNDLVYDLVTNKIYASIPSANGSNGNSIGVINPNTYLLENTIFIGSEPTVLAISDNGQYIYSGFSGSSMRLAMKDSPLLVHDAKPWQGDARFIRSDEWNILIQMAIGQVNAPKKFSVINSNVGIDGNNMLIIGMTGVPVSHVSSLAKPATWGFWILDMRSALAWHWWLPFFGCFLALWALMIRFFRLNWRIASATQYFSWRSALLCSTVF